MALRIAAMASELRALEQEKEAAVAVEDYDRAAILKREIDTIRLQIASGAGAESINASAAQPDTSATAAAGFSATKSLPGSVKTAAARKRPRLKAMRDFAAGQGRQRRVQGATSAQHLRKQMPYWQHIDSGDRSSPEGLSSLIGPKTVLLSAAAVVCWFFGRHPHMLSFFVESVINSGV